MFAVEIKVNALLFLGRLILRENLLPRVGSNYRMPHLDGYVYPVFEHRRSAILVLFSNAKG
jgi:hypothetical protein